MIAEVAEPETAVVVAVLPADQLAEINVSDAALNEMLATANSLSAEDKESYEITHNFCVMAMRTRKGIERIGKALTDPKKAEIKSINDEVERLVGRVREAEDIARPLKEGWETKEKERKEAAQKAALAKQHERTQQLINLGMIWNGGGGYDLDHFSVDAIEIKAAPDDQWTEIIGEVAEHVEQKRLQKIEADRIAEEERQAAALLLENQRLEQEAAQRQIQAQQDELNRQQAELKQQQEEFERQQRKLKADQDDVTLKNRVARLTEIGVICKDGGVYIEDDYIYGYRNLIDITEAEFKADIADFVVGIATRKEQAEAARLQAEKDEAARIKEEERLAQAKKKADRERTTRLKTERGIITAYLAKVGSVTNPKLEQPETKLLLDQFNIKLTSLLDDFRQQVTDL